MATPHPLNDPAKKRKSRDSKVAKKPKRPMTAYNYFFQEQRRKILSGEDKLDMIQGSRHRQKEKGIPDDAKSHGSDKVKVTFEELGRIIGQRWRIVSGEDLVHYKNLAEEDSRRYRREMKRYYEEEVSALCLGHNNPAPPSLFEREEDSPNGGEKAIAIEVEDDPVPWKKQKKHTETAQEKGNKNVQIQLSLNGALTVSPPSLPSEMNAATKIETVPRASPGLGSREVENSVGTVPPGSAPHLLHQLLALQQKDQAALAVLLANQAFAPGPGGCDGAIGGGLNLPNPLVMQQWQLQQQQQMQQHANQQAMIDSLSMQLLPTMNQPMITLPLTLQLMLTVTNTDLQGNPLALAPTSRGVALDYLARALSFLQHSTSQL